MATSYHLYKIALTDGQKQKLQNAFAEKSAVTLHVKPEQIGHGDELLLTNMVSEKKGADLKMSKTQIEKPFL